MRVTALAVARTVRAALVLAPLIATFVRDVNRYVLFGGPRELEQSDHRRRARRLTDAFEQLGISYIKLAQFLTTRPDLAPPIYLDEFARLQDQVEPEPYEAIRGVLEAELGPPEAVFDRVDPEPVSGASIGQVHRAEVDGEELALKVRRPGVVERMEADLLVMSTLIPIAVWFLERRGLRSHAESTRGITDELRRTLRQEVDFDREREIMEEIRAHVAEDGLDDRVVIPETYPDYSTERVLAMGFEDGVKIKNVAEVRTRGHDVVELVDTITEAYLRMAFVYRVYQADPHHGNIAVKDDGQVVLYDFGISQRPSERVADAFVRLFAGLGTRDADLVIAALEEMGAIDPGLDRETMAHVVEVMIKDIGGDRVTDADMRELEARVDRTLYDYPLKLNQEIVLAMRTTFGVEGLAAKIAPEYDFSGKLGAFFVERDLFDLDLEPVEEPADETATRAAVEGLGRELRSEVRRNGRRTALSTVGATLVVTAAVLRDGGARRLVVAPLAAIGAACFLLVGRSFGKRDEPGVVGPAGVATRHRMRRWTDESEAEAPRAPRGEPVAGTSD